MLVAYVESSAVTAVTGVIGRDNILNFLRNNVFPHEDNFAAHHYHLVRSFEEYSNTPLEGTNCGLKYHSHSVVPSMDVAKAGKVMMDQDETKAAHRKRNASAAFHRTPLYTTTATSRQLKPVAEGMLQEQCNLVESFASIRISETKWLVAFSAERSGPSTLVHRLPPTFERVRTVTLREEGRLNCSCGHMERNGAPCRHISHVAYKYGNSFDAFSHHDVAVRFWSCYDMFVAVDNLPEPLDDEKCAIRNNLWEARCCQPIGAYAKGGFCLYNAPHYVVGINSTAKWHSMDCTAALAFFNSCLDKKFEISNYRHCEVEAALAAMAAKSIHAVGMTQETYHGDGDGNSAVSNFQDMNDTDFSTWKVRRVGTVSAHDILAPRLKELASVYEHMPEKLLPLTIVLDEFIQRGKAINAALQPRPPVGHIVSSIVPNGCVQHAHTKQSTYK